MCFNKCRVGQWLASWQRSGRWICWSCCYWWWWTAVITYTAIQVIWWTTSASHPKVSLAKCSVLLLPFMCCFVSCTVIVSDFWSLYIHNFSDWFSSVFSVMWSLHGFLYSEWHQYQWPWVTLKVTFAIWNLPDSRTSGNIACINYSMFTRESESIHRLLF